MRAMIALPVVLMAAVPMAWQNPQQHEHPAPERLGRVHFATSCSPGVSAAFDRAVALLHSFSFSTAKQAFDDVLIKDPSCAIAHWGVAMTYWGNPFAGVRSPKALELGAAAVARAQTTGNPTARERDYIAAVAEEFKNYETVDQRTRVLAYERAMEHVYRTHPADPEAAAFYALAVNQTALPSDKTYAQQLKAAAILEKLWTVQPEHPGLPHYLIHAYDHPPLAPRALAAARSYAKIAPSAPHALHMPAHTFTRVGYWQESIDTNIASARAAMRDDSFGEALHAMDYQVYAYLQTGQDAAARRVVDEAPRVFARLDVNKMGGAAPGVAGLYAAGAIPARYALERGAWSDAAALQPQATSFPYVDALTRFARAVGAARSGRPGAARADLAELGVLAEKLAAARDADWSQRVGVQQQIASAWVTFAEGRKAEAVEMLRKAADAEDATDKSAISPGPLAPARELLGEMLLAVDRPADALKEFEATMVKEPNRFRATYDAAKAASLTGDRARARRYYRQLLDICKAGDTPGRPELQEARKLGAS
jgi:tetratricopeptide (TPR) repeat protein